jgi:hypothetical protein
MYRNMLDELEKNPKGLDFLFEAAELAGVSYLGGVNTSAKIIKNAKVSKVNTYCIYLAPANLSGYNTCSHSTPECRMGCLNTSGRAGMEQIAGKTITVDCRNKKSQLLFEQTNFFMQWLIAEIQTKKALSYKKGMDFAVRLNGTSDIDWSKILVNGKTIFELFSDVEIYDYTKNPNKFKNKPKNYHLTMSYTGRNWQVCEMLLQKRENVAVIFDVKKETDLPKEFRGYKVINGDLTDYRISDPKGVIVGLKWKKIADKQVNDYVRNSCFVVKQNKINGFITYNVEQVLKVEQTETEKIM